MMRPRSVAETGRWELTGNHYLALPCIAPADGGIHRVNVLHRGALGLIEWGSDERPDPAAAPLLAPDVTVDGERLPFRELAWERLDGWIPSFRARVGDDLTIRGTICAPGGGTPLVAGAVYRLEVENRGAERHDVVVSLAGTWRWSLRTVRTSRPLEARNRLVGASDGAGLVLVAGGEPSLASLAILGGAGATIAASSGTDEPRDLGPGATIAAENGTPIRFRVATRLELGPRQRGVAEFHIAAAVERDGAEARARTLQRVGGAELVRAARLELARMQRRVRDVALGAILNRNLLFNAFYAVARAIDDDRVYPIVSRAPDCPPGPVFRERDALAWSLPALLVTDSALAREVLLRALEQFSHQPGAELHYLDGGLLSPSFSLDGFCAYALAIDRYTRETGDESILDEPIVGEVLRDLDDLILDRLHPELLLATTEILASGELATHPYVTYDNVQLWALAGVITRLWPRLGGGARSNLSGAAEEIAATIWSHCTVEVDGYRLLAWSTDLEGEAAVYDDPEGSLMLLPALGFCDADDPLWRNTVDFLHSARYPFWLGDRAFPGMASRTWPDRASLPGLCTALLGPDPEDALALIERLRLEGDVACLTYDPDTGETVDGAYHAAAAGLLGWTLWQALGR